jgi:hypothetical protein
MNEALKDDEHNFVFIGRAGSFCPIAPGHGGGILLRQETDGRYSAATGTKGYRFLEAETVRGTDSEQFIDESYFKALVDDAISNISKFGDFYWFVADNKDIPWSTPCGDMTMSDCSNCPHFQKDHELCDLGFDISDVLLKM